MNLSVTLKATTKGNPKIATSDFPTKSGSSEDILEDLFSSAATFLAQYEYDIGLHKNVNERFFELVKDYPFSYLKIHRKL